MMNRTRRLGFMLPELLIVVIVLIILAGAALPQFTRMMWGGRAAEAQNMIGSILTAELLYYNNFGMFTNVMDRLMVDLPADANTNWDYAITAGDNTTGPVVATGTGDAGEVNGIVVTGTMNNDGSRTRSLPVAATCNPGC